MRDASGLRRDRDGLTAVIEFLSAFTLFLMILTAFLALAQMQMAQTTLTSTGWIAPPCSASTVWSQTKAGLSWLTAKPTWRTAHTLGTMSAEVLFDGRVRAGLVVDGKLDMDRLAALRNVTEQGFAEGLGLTRPLTCTCASISSTKTVPRTARCLKAEPRASAQKPPAEPRVWWSVRARCIAFRSRCTTAVAPHPCSR